MVGVIGMTSGEARIGAYLAAMIMEAGAATAARTRAGADNLVNPTHL
jgi:hypothetical protein